MRKSLIMPLIAGTMAIVTSCGSQGDKLSLDYIAVQTSKDAKWGFVGPDGKMLYEEEFEKMPSSVINGFFTVEEGEGVSVYKAEAKKPELVNGCEDLVGAGVMSDGVIPVTRKNERIKLLDASGKEKLTFMPVDNHEIVSVSGVAIDGAFCFETDDDKEGLINTSGKVLIPAKYDKLAYYYGGLAVGKVFGDPDSLGNRSEEFYLLDKNGKEIKKFKDELMLRSRVADGKALAFMAKDGDRIPGYIDTKGEFTKLPAKVKAFGNYFNGKEFSFETEDSKYGIMNLDGEVIIRPKYEEIGRYGEDKFYVKNGDSKWSILNKEGEKVETYDDFEYFTTLESPLLETGFEVVAAEKRHQIDFYTYEGKPITQESFYSANFDVNIPNVNTDYFNAEEVGFKIAELITADGVKGIKIGSPVAKALPADAQAEGYSNQTLFYLPDINGGYKWYLSVQVGTDGVIAEPIYTTKTETYWFTTYTRQVVSGYKFNDAKIKNFTITATSSKDFAEEASKAIVSSLKKRGFKEAKTEAPNTVELRKGDLVASVFAPEGLSTSLTVSVYSAKAQEAATEAVPDSVVAVEEVVEAVE